MIVTFTTPESTDGHAIHRLISQCPPLDANSLYCNLLQADHFSDTCLKAVSDQGTLMGFVSGYRHPKIQDCLFVWQVAIHEQARGQGLAKRLLLALLAQPACKSVRQIHTTITADNLASQRLFASLANALQCPLTKQAYFLQQPHFSGLHASEDLYQIGPFQPLSVEGNPL